MKSIKNTLYCIISSLLAIVLMAYVENVIQPGYWLKAIAKIAVFCGVIIIYCLITRQSVKDVIHLKIKPVDRRLVFFMLFAYGFIIVSFLLLRNRLDLASIKTSLVNKEHLTRSNFIFVYAYICIVNSFLEESFFRGFLTCSLRKSTNPLFAGIYSAVMFAVYHISILSGWFSPILTILCIASLAIVGIFMQYLSDRNDTILASWITHGCANLAINTIGTIIILFY